MIAYTSQLCHVISGAYIQNPLAPETPGYTAGSFADMSRVATMDADTWSDLFLENREHLLKSVDRFADEIADFRALLEKSDKAGMMAWIQKAADTKRALK